MAKCPDCAADLPQFALHCIECGGSVAAVTVKEQATLNRLRRLAGVRVDDDRTIQDDDLSAATLKEGDRALLVAAEEARAQGAPDTREMAGAPPARLVPLSEARHSAPDRGEPARRRGALPEDAPLEPPKATGSLVRVGEEVEGYVIEAEIGRGGMGRVYRAVHKQIGQRVAVKMLLPKFFDDARHLKRFLNEAKVLVHMQHPNLVPLLGFPTHLGRPFIVMPFIEGETLEALLLNGRLPLDRAFEIFRDLCAGLAYVHGNGIVHRDLKPANVLIRASDGAALLTDFGIARAVGTERLTMTGMVVGTAEYLSPEQASGESRDDARSDVYSVGVLLYEMVTGQVPFRHHSAAQVLLKQVSSPPPPPRTIAPDLPEALERVLLNVLEKDPDRRYQTVDALLEAVERAAAGEMPPAPIAVAETVEPRAVEPEPAPETRPAPSGVGRLIAQILLGASIGAAMATAVWYLLTRA